MRNRMYGGVRGREMKVGGKLLHFPPTRFVVKVFNCTFFFAELFGSFGKKMYFCNQ